MRNTLIAGTVAGLATFLAIQIIQTAWMLTGLSLTDFIWACAYGCFLIGMWTLINWLGDFVHWIFRQIRDALP